MAIEQQHLLLPIRLYYTPPVLLSASPSLRVSAFGHLTWFNGGLVKWWTTARQTASQQPASTRDRDYQNTGARHLQTSERGQQQPTQQQQQQQKQQKQQATASNSTATQQRRHSNPSNPSNPSKQYRSRSSSSSSRRRSDPSNYSSNPSNPSNPSTTTTTTTTTTNTKEARQTTRNPQSFEAPRFTHSPTHSIQLRSPRTVPEQSGKASQHPEAKVNHRCESRVQYSTSICYSPIHTTYLSTCFPLPLIHHTHHDPHHIYSNQPATQQHPNPPTPILAQQLGTPLPSPQNTKLQTYPDHEQTRETTPRSGEEIQSQSQSQTTIPPPPPLSPTNPLRNDGNYLLLFLAGSTNSSYSGSRVPAIDDTEGPRESK
ncbi:hypothetical protein BZA77DRAFT_377640 [Pyronema omphalodes]|nr:hypothetical protein BZA77DRAFT_377640 [Pyronema omphalodes]